MGHEKGGTGGEGCTVAISSASHIGRILSITEVLGAELYTSYCDTNQVGHLSTTDILHTPLHAPCSINPGAADPIENAGAINPGYRVQACCCDIRPKRHLNS